MWAEFVNYGRCDGILRFGGDHVLSRSAPFSIAFDAASIDPDWLAEGQEFVVYDVFDHEDTPQAVAHGLIYSPSLYDRDFQTVELQCQDLLHELSTVNLKETEIFAVINVAPLGAPNTSQPVRYAFAWDTYEEKYDLLFTSDSGWVWDNGTNGSYVMDQYGHLLILHNRPIANQGIYIDFTPEPNVQLSETGTVYLAVGRDRWREMSGVVDGTDTGTATLGQTGIISWTDADTINQRIAEVESGGQTYKGYGLIYDPIALQSILGFEADTINAFSLSVDPIDDLQKILDVATGWVITPNDTADGTMTIFDYESVLEGLIQVTYGRGAFRRGDGRNIDYLEAPATATMLATSGNAAGHENVCVIGTIQREPYNIDRVTRLYAFGGKNQDGEQVTLKDTATVPAGYEIDEDEGWIQAVGETTIIERRKVFDAVRVRFGSVIEETGDVLAIVAANHLAINKKQDVFGVTFDYLPKRLRVGDSLKVRYMGEDVTGKHVDIDASYVVWRVGFDYSEGMMRYSAVLGETLVAPKDIDEQQIERLFGSDLVIL